MPAEASTVTSATPVCVATWICASAGSPSVLAWGGSWPRETVRATVWAASDRRSWVSPAPTPARLVTTTTIRETIARAASTVTIPASDGRSGGGYSTRAEVWVALVGKARKDKIRGDELRGRGTERGEAQDGTTECRVIRGGTMQLVCRVLFADIAVIAEKTPVTHFLRQCG